MYLYVDVYVFGFVSLNHVKQFGAFNLGGDGFEFGDVRLDVGGCGN